MQPSDRSRIPSFLAMDVLAAANAREARGEKVLHLELGEPAGGAPPEALRAAERALASERLGYTDAMGMMHLRQRIARLYRDWHGLEVDPARIAVTAGASGGFVLAFLAAFDPGDRVVVTDPSYPCYRNMLAALGIEVVRLETGLADGFQPTLAALETLTGRIDGLVIASPANPTGSMIAGPKLARIAGWCEAHGIRLVADEIYHGLSYGAPARTVLHDSSTAIVVNSFSKFFCMTGWRIGWLVLPEDLMAPVLRLAQNLYISPSTVGQHAALGAFEAEAALAQRITAYAASRERLLGALATAGIADIAPADGAFYIYADMSRLTDDSTLFCERMLAETGIAATPGVDFDPVRGKRFVRFSFAAASQIIDEASRRLVDWLAGQRLPG